jgi:transcriptional regulator with XRE-family HTH domain
MVSISWLAARHVWAKTLAIYSPNLLGIAMAIRDATQDKVARAELETFMATRKPDPVDIEVGQRIKIQRLTAGLSQAQLGEEIGVTFQQVQKYEKGANRLGIGRLTRVARALNVTVNSFFEGRDMIERIVQTGGALPFSLITHPHAFRLLQAYSTLKNEELRRSIVELVERLATKSGDQNARRK